MLAVIKIILLYSFIIFIVDRGTEIFDNESITWSSDIDPKPEKTTFFGWLIWYFFGI